MQTAKPRQSSGNPALRTVGICLTLGVIAFFLLTEHRAHFFGALPYLLFLACPIIHLFMHRGHQHGSEPTDHGPEVHSQHGGVS